MKKIVIDCRVDDKAKKNLINKSFELIQCEKNPYFDDAVCAHPDMNMLIIKDKLFRTRFLSIDTHKNEQLVNISTSVAYPNDVLLNAICIGNDLICREKSLFTDALEYAKSLKMNIINVNQGYAKCNILPISIENKAVITEDRGIANTLIENGYEVLLLKSHAVNLKPYDYGFIGGCGGMVDNYIYFFGNVENHPEFAKINEFCKRHKKIPESLSSNALYDFGSIIQII